MWRYKNLLFFRYNRFKGFSKEFNYADGRFSSLRVRQPKLLKKSKRILSFKVATKYKNFRSNFFFKKHKYNFRFKVLNRRKFKIKRIVGSFYKRRSGRLSCDRGLERYKNEFIVLN